MKYLKLRLKLWRVNNAINSGNAVSAARLLQVPLGDKTMEEFVFALEIAHRELMSATIECGK